MTPFSLTLGWRLDLLLPPTNDSQISLSTVEKSDRTDYLVSLDIFTHYSYS